MMDFQGAKIGSLIKCRYQTNAKGSLSPFALAGKIVDFFSPSSLNVRGGGNLVMATLRVISVFSKFVHSSRVRQPRMQN